jgi:hypothetical protein
MNYPLTFYTNFGVGKTARGSTRMCFIFIRPQYRFNDEGLYQHELTHVKQWAVVTALSAVVMSAVCFLSSLFFPSMLLVPLAALFLIVLLLSMSVFSFMYGAIPKVRLWAEVQAFKKQLQYYPDDRTERFARAIARFYNLKVGQDKVAKMLRS